MHAHGVLHRGVGKGEKGRATLCKMHKLNIDFPEKQESTWNSKRVKCIQQLENNYYACGGYT